MRSAPRGIIEDHTVFPSPRNDAHGRDGLPKMSPDRLYKPFLEASLVYNRLVFPWLQVGELRKARGRRRYQRRSRSGGCGGARGRSCSLASLRPSLSTVLRGPVDTSPQVRESATGVAMRAVLSQPANREIELIKPKGRFEPALKGYRTPAAEAAGWIRHVPTMPNLHSE